MTALRTPDSRACRRCGRIEEWDPDAETWTVPDGEGAAVGNVHCIHEWDITGSFRPFDEE